MATIIKFARTEDEFNQIHQLNYETFVEEIPQHEENEEHRLVDRFHDENEYIICLKDGELVGMISLRSTRPFSLDLKLGDVRKYLPDSIKNPCEVRLLAVKKNERNGRIFFKLAAALSRYCYLQGFDAALISGTTRELKLYKHLGFQPFAHLVGKEGAYFQPMVLTRDAFEQTVAGKLKAKMKFYLPGPIDVSDNIKNVFFEQPLWHRSRIYTYLLDEVKEKLIKLTNAEDVQLMMGSGTLANDMVAAQLSMLDGKGLILVNGEFGDRLTDHAERLLLNYSVLRFNWGEPFDQEKIENELKKGGYSWIWAVHCETSTGMINDLDLLKKICKKYSCQLCLDCISSIGSLPVDLSDVYLASGVSGKAIGSIAGISFIFHPKNIEGLKKFPRYLDLQLYKKYQGIPYTQSSYLMKALNAALTKVLEPDFFQWRRERYEKFIKLLKENGIHPLIDEQYQSPTVVTIPFENPVSSLEIGDDLLLNGYYVHSKNRYLLERNWLQISLMGETSDEDDEKLVQLLAQLKQIQENLKVKRSEDC